MYDLATYSRAMKSNRLLSERQFSSVSQSAHVVLCFTPSQICFGRSSEERRVIACIECVAILVCYAAYCILPPLRIVFEVITTAAANSSHVPRTNPKTSLVLEASTRATENIFLTGFWKLPAQSFGLMLLLCFTSLCWRQILTEIRIRFSRDSTITSTNYWLDA